MNTQQIEEMVTQLVSRYTARPTAALRSGTRLLQDLGMTGDDAVDLLNDFFSAFPIETSSFSFEDYFYPEAIWPWQIFHRRKKIPLTIADLVRIAEAGKWMVPGQRKAVGTD